MKKYTLVLICFLLVQYSYSQVFKGEIIVGGSLTQVDGDELYGYRKVGANAGLGVLLPFSFRKGDDEKNWGLSMEILFNQKGSREKNYTGINFCDTCPPEIPCDPDMKYHLKMNYVSIPLVLNYTDKNGWSLGLGVAYNRLGWIKEIETGLNKENIHAVSTIISPSKKKIEKMLVSRNALFAKDELSVLVDVRMRIWQQLKFNVRFEYSIFPIGVRKFFLHQGVPIDPYIRRQYHNLLSFRLIYMLNEPKVEIEKKAKTKQEDKIYYY